MTQGGIVIEVDFKIIKQRKFKFCGFVA
jgi:hypothetical protein